jgi:hypothetical protein
MAEKWWSFRAAQFHVAANCPCDSWAQARGLINSKILEGVLPTRYRIGDGAPAPIDPSAWRRDPGRGGVPSWMGLEWNGWDKEQLRSRHCLVVFETEPKAVKRLCAARPALVGPPAGRATEDWQLFYRRVVVLAINAEFPEAPARLTRIMAAWCQENMEYPPEDETIAKEVRELYRAIGESNGV